MTIKNSGLVVIGGGQATTQLIEVARQEGYNDPITLISDETVLPYQRPPLSKQYLAGGYTEDWLLYRPEKFYATNDVTLRLGETVKSINRTERTVTLASGEMIAYDKLALATGTRAKSLCAEITVNNIYYIRTLADIDRLKPELPDLHHIVIIGAGFIGLETAAILIKLGKKVSLLARNDQILPRLGCHDLSRFLHHYHQQQGVNITLNTSVTKITRQDGQLQISCDTGASYACDAVIIGIGAIPNTELADAAGLECDNGIVVDEYALTSDPNIVAAGDCTNHPNPLSQQRIRLETVHNAIEQGRTAGFSIAGKQQAYNQTPWVWSDQYTLRIQSVGIPDGFDKSIVRGDNQSESFSIFYFYGERLLAVTAVNQPRIFATARRILNEGLKLSKVEAADLNFDLTTLLKNRTKLDFENPWPSRAEKGLVRDWGHA